MTFKSVGTVNRSKRSNSIGAIDMPILSLEGNYNGCAGATHTGGHPHWGGAIHTSKKRGVHDVQLFTERS